MLMNERIRLYRVPSAHHFNETRQEAWVLEIDVL